MKPVEIGPIEGRNHSDVGWAIARLAGFGDDAVYAYKLGENGVRVGTMVYHPQVAKRPGFSPRLDQPDIVVTKMGLDRFQVEFGDRVAPRFVDTDRINQFLSEVSP